MGRPPLSPAHSLGASPPSGGPCDQTRTSPPFHVPHLSLRRLWLRGHEHPPQNNKNRGAGAAGSCTPFGKRFPSKTSVWSPFPTASVQSHLRPTPGAPGLRACVRGTWEVTSGGPVGTTALHLHDNPLSAARPLLYGEEGRRKPVPGGGAGKWRRKGLHAGAPALRAGTVGEGRGDRRAAWNQGFLKRFAC